MSQIGYSLFLHTAKWNAEMRRASAELKRFGMDRKQINERFSNDLRQQRDDFRAVALQAGAYIMALQKMAQVFGTITVAAQKFQFEARALSVLMNGNADAGAKLYKQFEQVNPAIKEFAPVEVVQRLKTLMQAGYSGAEALKHMGAIADTVTASLGSLSTDQAIELGVNLDKGFGKAGQSMRDMMDVAVAASNQFPMTTAQITTALGYATEGAVQFDQSLDSVLVTMGLLIPVVKTAAKAGTAYRNMQKALVRTETVDFFKREGIEVRQANGQFRDLLDIYTDMNVALDKLGEKDKKARDFKREQLMQKLGGTRGAAGFAAVERAQMTITGRGQFEGARFADPRAAILASRMGLGGQSTNAAGRIAEEMRKTSEIIEKSFNASLDKASLAIGNLFLPAIDSLRQSFTWLVDKVQAVAELFGEMPRVLNAFGTALSAIVIAASAHITGKVLGLAGSAVKQGFGTFKRINAGVVQNTPKGGAYYKKGGVFGPGSSYGTVTSAASSAGSAAAGATGFLSKMAGGVARFLPFLGPISFGIMAVVELLSWINKRSETEQKRADAVYTGLAQLREGVQFWQDMKLGKVSQRDITHGRYAGKTEAVQFGATIESARLQGIPIDQAISKLTDVMLKQLPGDMRKKWLAEGRGKELADDVKAAQFAVSAAYDGKVEGLGEKGLLSSLKVSLASFQKGGLLSMLTGGDTADRLAQLRQQKTGGWAGMSESERMLAKTELHLLEKPSPLTGPDYHGPTSTEAAARPEQLGFLASLWNSNPMRSSDMATPSMDDIQGLIKKGVQDAIKESGGVWREALKAIASENMAKPVLEPGDL